MTPELERQIKKYRQWFGSYKKSGELKKIHVWLTVNDGWIEFLTAGDSYKAKRVRRNPRVVCFVGNENGPAIPGTAEVLTGADSLRRVYRAYQKSHSISMLWLGAFMKRRLESGKQVAIRVTPDEPNPLAGVTDPTV